MKSLGAGFGDEIELYSGATNIIDVFQVIALRRSLSAGASRRDALFRAATKHLQSRVAKTGNKGLAIHKGSSLRLVVDSDGGTAVLGAKDLQTADEVPLLDLFVARTWLVKKRAK